LKVEGRQVVVTGATGFVGSHLVDALVERSDQVAWVNAVLGSADRPLGHVGSVEQPGNEQLALVGESQDSPRALIGRNDVDRVPQHVVSHRRQLPRLHRRLHRRLKFRIQRRHSLRDVRIVGGAAPGRARRRAGAEAPAAKSAACRAHAEALAVVAEHGEVVADANGKMLVHNQSVA